MTATGGDGDGYPQPGDGVGCGGTGFTLITSNHLQKFAGVDGPGVIVRSNGRRQRAVHRAREEGNSPANFTATTIPG